MRITELTIQGTGGTAKIRLDGADRMLADYRQSDGSGRVVVLPKRSRGEMLLCILGEDGDESLAMCKSAVRLVANATVPASSQPAT